MQNQSEYFVVCISYKSGNEAVVDPNHLWSDVLDLIHEAACDGNAVLFVHHIKDGKVTDRTQEALDLTRNFLADHCQPLSGPERDWVESMFGLDVARHFRSAA